MAGDGGAEDCGVAVGVVPVPLGIFCEQRGEEVGEVAVDEDEGCEGAWGEVFGDEEEELRGEGGEEGSGREGSEECEEGH